MARNKGKKGDIEILVEPITGAKVYTSLGNIKVAYGDSQYKELSAILTDYAETRKDVQELKQQNLKLKTNLTKTLSIINVLAKQLQVNNTEVLDLINKNTMEEN